MHTQAPVPKWAECHTLDRNASRPILLAPGLRTQPRTHRVCSSLILFFPLLLWVFFPSRMRHAVFRRPLSPTIVQGPFSPKHTRQLQEVPHCCRAQVARANTWASLFPSSVWGCWCLGAGAPFPVSPQWWFLSAAASASRLGSLLSPLDHAGLRVWRRRNRTSYLAIPTLFSSLPFSLQIIKTSEEILQSSFFTLDFSILLYLQIGVFNVVFLMFYSN